MIGFERLTDANGDPYVRALYRAQSLDQIRSLTPLDGVLEAPYLAVLPIPGCHARGVAGLCAMRDFMALMEWRLSKQ